MMILRRRDTRNVSAYTHTAKTAQMVYIKIIGESAEEPVSRLYVKVPSPAEF
jgi:hypothetical protein